MDLRPVCLPTEEILTLLPGDFLEALARRTGYNFQSYRREGWSVLPITSSMQSSAAWGEGKSPSPPSLLTWCPSSLLVAEG